MNIDLAELNKDELLSYILEGKLDETDLLELVTDNDFDIAFAVANCKYSTEPILDIAAHDLDERIRLAVVNNVNCSVKTLHHLEKDNNAIIASAATRRLNKEASPK